MASMTYSLYLATNVVNGMQYVGLAKNLKKRLISHKCAASNTLFHKAIKQYGHENFVFSHIADAFDVECARSLERLLIEQHNTYVPNGYNSTVGGQVGFTGKHSEKTKQLLSEKNKNRSSDVKNKFVYSQKGKVRSDEFKARASEAGKKRKHTPESIQKMKLAWIARKQAKQQADTIVQNLKLKEIPNGVTP